MEGIWANVEADSVNAWGMRLTTMQLRMPRFLLAQFNTHRMFSRNAASSRAMPAKVMVERVNAEPFIPQLTVRKSGMASNETVGEAEQAEFEADVRNLLWAATQFSGKWSGRGHKQHVNRYLEPFAYVDVLVTATEWSNFFKLRLHDAAQPEMQTLARMMADALKESKPKLMQPGEWHMPFRRLMPLGVDLATRLKIATARCARLSYSTHEGEFSADKDVELHDRLVEEGHLSTLEHCAACDVGEKWHANFRGWESYRRQRERGKW